MKLLKSKESRELERAKQEAEKQQTIIKGLEAKAKLRADRIATLDYEYQRKLNEYRMRCDLMGVNQKPSARLLIMMRTVQWDRVTPAQYPSIFADYGLIELFTEIDRIGKPGEQPPEKPVIEDLE
jgi:hypothetical protein